MQEEQRKGNKSTVFDSLKEKLKAVREQRRIDRRLKKEQNALRIMRWPKLVLGILVMALIFALVMGQLNRIKNEMGTAETALRNQLTSEQNSGNKIQDKIDEVSTRAYIENRARAELQYINPGELRFEIINPEELDSETPEQKKLRKELER